MKIIVLPGNSVRNKEWAEGLAGAYSDMAEGGDVYVQNYSHWESGDDFIDLDTELEKLKKEAQGDYMIFAKSAGLMLAIYGVVKGVLDPKKCVFFGVPLVWARAHNFKLDSWLAKFNLPALVFQNDKDPITTFAQVKDFIDTNNKTNFQLKELSGDDHSYKDFEKMRADILAFLS